MKSMIAGALITLFSLSGVCRCQTQDLYFGGFDGTWEGRLAGGTLDLKTFDFAVPRSDLTYRIVVAGATVHVLFIDKSKNEVSEVKQDEFRIVSDKTNAVIYTMDNYLEPVTKDIARIMYVGGGEFARMR
jgi:hypothetical protein